MQVARDNPFAVHRVLRVRYTIDEAGWSGLLERLARHRYRGAIVGPHGAGKTTLLEDLALRLESREWRVRIQTLTTEKPCLPRGFGRGVLARLDRRDALLIDGAEQLGALAWARLRLQARRVGALITTTHHAGRLPTVHQCTTSPELLVSIVAQLGQALDLAQARVLFAHHRGNLREVLRELYDRRAAGLSICGRPAA